MNRKTASMLSLCRRAGCMVSGELPAEDALKENKALLIIIAGDASENTKKKFLNKSKHYNVNAVVYGSKEELSAAIGEYNRSVFAVIGNEHFADEIYTLISQAVI
ncbi:MAG: ribosomal L7Ae/L30e/S12e/Gadd45 family protein [Firmicutes bacterium]|nr:ribosomal L7Ae/L30e/S12e/Gadd45 family protein [Bacillota bacterium]